jgi:hypothetical protein
MGMNKEVMLAVEAISAAVAALVDRHYGFVSAAKIDDLLKKEDNKPFEEDLKAINSEDSTPTKKYLDWGLSRLKAGDDVEDIVATMMSFDKAVQRLSEKDIKKYGTLADINKAIKDIESKPSARGTKRKGKHSAEILFEDDNWMLVHPTNRTSAIYYGSNTSWCISRRDLTKNLFYQYSLNNIQFYILIDKSKINEVKSLNSKSAGRDFSKLAMLFKDGVSLYGEPFEDANNKAPPMAAVKEALGEETFNTMYGIAKEHAVKHNKTPTLAYELKTSKDPVRIAEIISKLEDDDEHINKALLANEHSPRGAINKYLVKQAGSEDIYARGDVARNTSAPAEALIILAGDKYEYVRLAVAENTSTPAEALIKLADDNDTEVRRYVARNTSAPAEVLSKLASEDDWAIRYAVARHLSAPSEALIKLAGDNNDVRHQVAQNESAPPELLIKLAGDKTEFVRRSVAFNPSTPSEALVILAGDENDGVRQALAQNTSAPADIIVKLAGDKDVNVRLGSVHESTPPEALVILAGDENEYVRDAVARNKSTPPEALIKLADDSNDGIRFAVARNPSTPTEVLIKLARDLNYNVSIMAEKTLAKIKAAEAISAAVAALVDHHGSFISAAKIDDLLKKEDNKPFEEDLRTINSEDTTPTKKYLDWGLSRLRAGDSVDDIVATMMSFEKSLNRLSEKDIKKYKTLEDINKAVKDLESKPSARGTKRKGKHSAEILFEDDNWLLLHPLNRTSAIYYGSNTSWCISRRDLTKNLFYQYSLNNIQFYILIDKSKQKEAKSPDGEEDTLHDFSKLAIMFVEGKSHLNEPFEDANNKQPTLAVVKDALGEELFNSMNGIAKEHAAKHKETLAHEMAHSDDPKRIAEILNSLEDDSKLSKALLANKYAPREARAKSLITVTSDDDPFVRMIAAEDTSAPPEALIKLADDRNEYVRVEVAKNTSTPSEALIKLSGELVFGVRHGVAGNTSSPPEALIKLAADNEDNVRISVARNLSAPPEALIKLAGDEDIYVRRNVARNTSSPPEALDKLLVDDKDTRLMVAMNPSTPADILNKLAGDESDYIRRVATEALARKKVAAAVSAANKAIRSIRSGLFGS